MKKIIGICSVLVLLFMVGCSKDDDPKEQKATPETIRGVWMRTGYSYTRTTVRRDSNGVVTHSRDEDFTYLYDAEFDELLAAGFIKYTSDTCVQYHSSYDFPPKAYTLKDGQLFSHWIDSIYDFSSDKLVFDSIIIRYDTISSVLMLGDKLIFQRDYYRAETPSSYDKSVITTEGWDRYEFEKVPADWVLPLIWKSGPQKDQNDPKNNELSGAFELTEGTFSIRHSIDSNDDIDWFSFDAKAGKKYLIEVKSASYPLLNFEEEDNKSYYVRTFPYKEENTLGVQKRRLLTAQGDERVSFSVRGNICYYAIKISETDLVLPK